MERVFSDLFLSGYNSQTKTISSNLWSTQKYRHWKVLSDFVFYPEIIRRNAPLDHPPLNETTPRIKIVFVLTVNGRAVRQVVRLLRVIYSPYHFYYIHVDKVKHGVIVGTGSLFCCPFIFSTVFLLLLISNPVLWICWVDGTSFTWLIILYKF